MDAWAKATVTLVNDDVIEGHVRERQGWLQVASEWRLNGVRDGHKPMSIPAHQVEIVVYDAESDS